jgi:hypothetical protein
MTRWWGWSLLREDVPGVDTERHEGSLRVSIKYPHLGKATCSCGWTSGPGYIGIGDAEARGVTHRARTNQNGAGA